MSTSKDRFERYTELASSFLQGRMSAVDFQQRYGEIYLHDTTEWTDTEFDILDGLFGDVEAFVADPELRRHIPEGIDEEELRRCAQRALDEIHRLRSNSA